MAIRLLKSLIVGTFIIGIPIWAMAFFIDFLQSSLDKETANHIIMYLLLSPVLILVGACFLSDKKK